MKRTFLILGAIVIMAVAFVMIDKNADVNNIEMNETLNTNQLESKIFPNDVVSENSPSKDDSQTGSVQSSPIIVNGGIFYFNPNIIKVKQGETVTIVFKNEGGMHDFVIDEFNARTQVLKDGAEQTISFVAGQKGSFEYYCSVGQHRQMGMKGTLIVE